jgi:ribosomal protein L44E
MLKEGHRAREECSCNLKAKRRRLSRKQPDLMGAFEPQPHALAVPVNHEDALGHVLMVVNVVAITWCNKCGSYTNTHVKGLGKACSGAPGSGKVKVLNRLRGGRDPLTNEPIGNSSRLMLE